MEFYRSTKDIAATVRAELKRQLPAWKFSVRTQNYSGGSAIHLSLMSGPEQVFAPKLDTTSKVYVRTYYPKYAQLNHYQLEEIPNHYRNNGAELTPVGWAVMKRANEILSAEHWDKSDAQIDYFCCNFYRHVEIGQWNKPFKVKE